MISIQLQVVPGSKATFEDLLVVEQYSPEKETDSEDYLAFVESSIGNLRKNHREILTSLNAGNSTYEKIASDLGLSLGSVKSRIYRARECLNRLLKYREENIDMT